MKKLIDICIPILLLLISGLVLFSTYIELTAEPKVECTKIQEIHHIYHVVPDDVRFMRGYE